jgi:hypothetical protein
MLAQLLVALFLIAACNSETKQTESVTTTTEKGTSTAPPAKEVESRSNVLVRMAHAIPGTPAVDLFVDDAKSFTDVSYKTVTPYKEISSGKHTYRLRLTGQDTAQPLAEGSDRLSDAGAHYTLWALTGTGALSKAVDLKFIKDDLSPPANGKAKVRVLNSSPDMGEVDIYVQGKQDALFKGINFADENAYKEIDPINSALEVRPEGKNFAALTIPNANFEAGKLYTIFIVGQTKGTTKLEGVVVSDALSNSTSTSDKVNANH